MKRALKWILSLFLVLALLLGAAWFFLRYQPEIYFPSLLIYFDQIAARLSAE